MFFLDYINLYVLPSFFAAVSGSQEAMNRKLKRRQECVVDLEVYVE